MAISFFYAVGTAIGGITGPLLFGRLIETGGETNVMYGYLLGAALMIAAGVVEIVLGVEAAQKQLEDIAKPLTAEDAEAGRGRTATTRRRQAQGRGRGARSRREDDGSASSERPATRRPRSPEVRHEQRLVPVPLELERGHRGERPVPRARDRACSSAPSRSRASCAGASSAGSSAASTGAPAASAAPCKAAVREGRLAPPAARRLRPRPLSAAPGRPRVRARGGRRRRGRA